MDNLPIPFSIFDKTSHLKKLLEKYKSFDKKTIEILVGENKGPVLLDLNKVGHLLLVGWSMSQKEFILDAILQSLMTRYTPEEVRFILADGQADLSQYGQSPYLLTEVIHEYEKVVSALKWSLAEVDSRYKDFGKDFVKDIGEFNNQSPEKKPRIIFIIKTIEYFSLFAPLDIRDMLESIASRGAKAGVHLILVADKIRKESISASILSNIPNRVVCQMTTKKDSLDAGVQEADQLKTNEMYLKIFGEKLQKVNMIDISEKDIKTIRGYFKKYFPYSIIPKEDVTLLSVEDSELDPLFNQVVELISTLEYASASLIQRRFQLGFARSAKILDQLEAMGFIGPAEGSKPREIFKKNNASGVKDGES